MAETVKENGRKRRPPSHLSQGYNQGNADPAKTLNSTRTVVLKIFRTKPIATHPPCL